MTSLIPPSALNHLDQSFGDEGEVNLQNLFSDVHITGVRSLLLLPDRSIVAGVLGVAGGKEGSLLVKLLPNGQVDTAFAAKGYLNEGYSEAGYSSSTPESLVLLEYDRFLVVTRCISGSGEYIPACTCYHFDGTRVVEFGNNGRIILNSLLPPLPTTEHARATSGQSHTRHAAGVLNGKITFSFNHARVGVGYERSYLIRLTQEGNVDNTYNDKGFADIPFGDDFMRIESLTPYDKTWGTWIVGGYKDPTGLITRVDDNGHVDRTFGVDGFYLNTSRAGSRLYGTFVDQQQKVIVAGVDESGGGDLADDGLVFRLDAKGALDESFIQTHKNVDGQRTVLQWIDATGTGGDVWVAGFVVSASNSLYGFLARYLPNGVPDESFGDRGYLFVENLMWVFDLVVQPDGKCLILGDDYVKQPVPKVRRFLAS